ncbi:hypothetical protein QBC42DRAFT_169291 [Cladorrhinum samala]|uniref:F-box domain-containing protein n=1 Tax=Cladorrhinum samala TaxID=585594 RepID=A0AAV9I1U0_9PEZI|nr:hypothetical protein QBC42DRAFT_169291 [Cladorrhinum samala]
MSATGQLQHIAAQLDKLPLELVEPIISGLTFRDVLALTKGVQEGSHLWNAFAVSPTWWKIWPMIAEYRDGFETLVSLTITVNGRVFDLRGGALMGTAGEFLRKLDSLEDSVKREAWRHEGVDRGGWAPVFFGIMGVRASGLLAQILAEMGRGHILYLCQEMPIDAICALAPWLSPQGDLSEPELRFRFLKFLESSCLCNSHRVESDECGWPGLGRNPVPGGAAARMEHARRCRERHPGQPTGNWSVPQIKVFLAAYAEVQLKLNAAKSDQLRDLAELYRRHHSRLREPLAPQTPRKNVEHIPRQLGVTARRVKQTIDLEKVPAARRIIKQSHRKHQGVSRFRYPHACFVPYDWCLELWTRIVAELEGAGMEEGVGKEPGEKDHPADEGEGILSLGVGGISLRDKQAAAAATTATKTKTTRSASHVPENIQKSIQIVKRGMDTYFVTEYKDEDIGDKLPVYDEKAKIGFYGLPRTTEGKDGELDI